LHLSLSVAIPAIQPRLRLSGTNRLRFAFHGDQRLMAFYDFPAPHWQSIRTSNLIESQGI
ncbi:MAG: hypothetical protein KZQ66_02685, partial [Candidatus Thiodiazotropha sp. (ex Lucinoma aequizonata)]|nr:hypothetical protein [Candidatus Thiodiazotropha sp. (ex Lucinoma aequizonata)]MCU7894788.1 hypothetical protein [Candidatus Thiodiazotropha sp. (ex Lucinoma aequizonata)]MCU7898149.1 hypothetical protein [Candidatus Thiodiazotropha sp. (ex Lucinoma aequizonata)]MCU7901044.1 hypothetical protein [Candidatus Thiodiazotropha sp. (ex Lucinoma aequizonata)]